MAANFTSLNLTSNEQAVLAAVIAGMKNLNLRDEVTFEDIATATGKTVSSVRITVGNLVSQGFLTCARPVGGTEFDPCYVNLADEHMGLHPAAAPSKIERFVSVFAQPRTRQEAKALLQDVGPNYFHTMICNLTRKGQLVRVGRSCYQIAA